MKKTFEFLLFPIFRLAPKFFVLITFFNIWRLRNYLCIIRTKKGAVFKGLHCVFNILNNAYWDKYGSFIGILAKFETPPIFPHGPQGIFISNAAHIGKNCVIFQHVTIGSNTLKDSNKKGAPYLCNNVYIGAGAKLIGKIIVGDNVRVGANCVVVKDVPANSIAVIRGIEFIQKKTELQNDYVPITEYFKGDK